jgi:glycosyltransferase involved in cell wall biosynthesis
MFFSRRAAAAPEGLASRPPRVCFVTGAYPPVVCGIGDYTANLCGALARKGLEVSVVTSSYLGIPRRDHGNPRVFPIINSWRVHQARKAIRIINHIKPEIVVFQVPHPQYRRRTFCNLLIPLIKAFRPSAKIVVTFHEMIEVRDVSWKRVLSVARVIAWVAGSDAVVLVSPSYVDVFRAVIHKLWPWTQTVPVCVIPVASSIPSYTLGSEELRRLREEMGFPAASCLLTYFGFVHPEKGFEDVLSVLSRTRQGGAPAHLLIVGNLDAGDPYHCDMQMRIKRDGLQDHVTVTGFLSAQTVANYLAMSDACILPFRSGVHPKSTTFLAARSQGVFTLTTSADGTGYSEEENVFYSRPGDVEAMTDAVCRYGGRKLGSDATCQLPTWEGVAELHRKLFCDLTSGGESQ